MLWLLNNQQIGPVPEAAVSSNQLEPTRLSPLVEGVEGLRSGLDRRGDWADSPRGSTGPLNSSPNH